MTISKKILLLASSLLFSISALACDELPIYLVPQSSVPVTELCRTEFEIGYSPELKSPLWVGALLTASEAETIEIRKNLFRADPNLPAGQKAQLTDYAKSGYDRGHMFSAGDAATEQGMIESFYLSNMVPQNPANNRGIWRQLEDKVRELAVKRHSIYVFIGPIFPAVPKTIGQNSIPVPTELFKVIFDAHSNESLTIIVPNSKVSSLEPYISNLDTLRTKTSIVFLPNQKATELDTLPF